MLLTLYYMAATWVQAWRLSSLRAKISELLSNGAGLVLYREPDIAAFPKHANTTDAWSQHLQGVSSTLCNNEHEARVADLLWYCNSKRGCSILPQQHINVSQWIAISEGSSTFPLKASLTAPFESLGSSEGEPLHLLIEAEYKEGIKVDGELVHHCEVGQFGIPHAWLASDIFGMIIQTDVEHLAKLCSCFMVNRLSIHDCLEMTRIQTIIVQGHPCEVSQSSGIITGSSSYTDFFEGLSSVAREAATGAGDVSPKTSFIELIKALSRAAHEATQESDEVPVTTAQGSTIVVSARSQVSPSPLPGDTPEVEVPLISEEPSKSLNHIEEPSMQTLSVGGRSSDSFCSLDSFATTSLSRPGVSPGRSPARSALSTISAAYSSLSLASVTSISASKPPNVLIYSDSAVVQDNVGAVLRNTLHRHKYTIYSMSRQSLLSSPWIHSTRLLVVCGTVPDALAPLFLSFLLNGGRVLCLCSDFLHLVLPTFRTAEVRQHELVRFSYARWKNVPMMHHVFCYQASPVHTRFPTGNSSSPRNNAGCGKPPATPASVEVVDSDNKRHTLRVEVLGAEETWQTPSLLLATTGDGTSAGRIVFSQVHLEIDPSQYESEEGKYSTLRQSDCARREILRDLLSSHLDMECGDSADVKGLCYTPSYFLGRHELKQEMLASLQSRLKGNTLKVGNLELQFCGKGESPPAATERLLPVLMHACPPCFSTVEYFENLRSERLGRLVIHSEVIGSSMQILGSEALWHGLAVIPLAQTSGRGRSANSWISPPGCAMTSLQLIIPLDSQLGQHASLIQHITATSVVSALSSLPSYAPALDLRLKWPNDIYIMTDNGLVKIGGLIVACTSLGSSLICNIGLGCNLDNRDPTTCINEQLMLYNARSGKKVPTLSLERFLALLFTEMERLINLMQDGHSDTVMDLYYKFWLHSDAEIIVRDTSGKDRPVTVQGVDEFGFLLVREPNGKVFSVQPDGNSFDMCIGLVAPKSM